MIGCVAASVVIGVLLLIAFPAQASRSDGASRTESTTESTTESAPVAGSSGHRGQLGAGRAAVLGLVEGATEFLPISSSGHLIVVERLMGIGSDESSKDAADTYTVAIQFGAILAVVVLYSSRLRSMADGVLGRDPSGRRTVVALIIATIPAVVIGVLGEAFIKTHLLDLWPVVAAWIVGAIVLFATADRFRADRGGITIDQVGVRQALVIGGAQCIALWPGTSRSLATILGALIAGLSLGAAIEFSFLLGLVTLSGATAYELVKNGSTMFAAFGWIDPLIGAAVAFVAALVAVRWMVSYLQRHDLRIFAWYRLAAAAVTVILITTGVIKA